MTPIDKALEPLQMRAMRVIAAYVWVHAPLIAGIAILTGKSPVLLTLVALGLAALSEIAVRYLPGNQSRPAVAIALAGQAALITAALSGHAWQIDSHMYFFAAVAILAAMVDYRALAAAVGVVAVHHLALNFLAPALVYPGGGDIVRTIMHAVILLVEAAALALAIRDRRAALGGSVAARGEAEASAKSAEDALAEAQQADARASDARSQTLRTVEEEIGVMIDAGLAGSFGHRITTRFEDDVMNRLADRMNTLYASVDGVLDDLETRLGALATGDLSTTMDTALSGRFEELRASVNGTILALQDLTGEIKSTTAVSRETASAMAHDAHELSRRNESQAASVEETSATMEQLKLTIESNAAHLTKAVTRVEDLSQTANQGGRIVADAIDAVAKIEASSARITDIVNVIDSIAFQTNLLALNAAVEAARAGESGKGFAVVASEVRTLAQRASDAARDISELIAASSASVSTGVTLVRNTGDALSDITSQLETLTGTITEVGAAGQEEARSIAEIRTVIQSIDEITQSNAQLADRGASAARDVQTNLDALAALTGRFRQDIAPVPATVAAE